jgi:hypothetical protein
MANKQLGLKGQIKLEFRYKKDSNSTVQVESIEPERISFLMIDHLYENVHILPVIYIRLNVSSEMYSKIVSSVETSTFHLIVHKKDGLSNVSIYKKILDDVFTYVTSSTNPNYFDTLNKDSVDPHYGITIGLVSESMTNKLRQKFNGIYNNISLSELVSMAVEGLGNKLLMAPVDNDTHYDSILIPPISSRYKLLEYLNSRYPYYNSSYTFYMDFNRTYLIPKGTKVEDGNKVSVANIYIKNYTASDAVQDGYSVVNGSYVMNINASETNVTVNTATSKVTNNIIGYSDYIGVQDYNIYNYNTEGNTQKTVYTRGFDVSKDVNDIENSNVLIQLVKQNIDADVFNPNMQFNVTNYSNFGKYDGRYYLSFKREIYSITSSGEFRISCNIGLKSVGVEEIALHNSNSYNKPNIATNNGSIRTSSNALYNGNNSRSRNNS